MKKIRLLSLLWIVFLAGSLAGCENSSNNESNSTWDFVVEDITWESDAVIKYNDTLVDLASQCIISEDLVWNVYDNENAWIEDIQKAVNDTIAECSKAWENINELGDREGDSSLKDWVLSIIEKEIAYYSKFKELLPYLEKEELTDDEELAYENLFSEIEALDSELSQANDNLVSIQEDFAKAHWFELEAEETTVEATEETTEEVEEVVE